MIFKKKLILFSLIITFPFLISAMVITTAPNETEKIDVTENIKLYSNGKLIGEWTGIGRGQAEGNSYIFTTSRGAFREDVRIQGDFIVERSAN